MESSALVAIKQQIEKEQAGLRTVANKLEAELAAVEAQLDKLAAALAALNGQEATLPAAAKKSAVRKKSDKPAAGKAEVAKQLAAILGEEEILEEAALRARAEARLTEAGFSRMGFALRFQEALQDPRFVDTPGGIRLVETSEPALRSS